MAVLTVWIETILMGFGLALVLLFMRAVTSTRPPSTPASKREGTVALLTILLALVGMTMLRIATGAHAV